MLYDIGVPIALIWHWFTFFKDMGHTRPERPGQQQIRHDGR